MALNDLKIESIIKNGQNAIDVEFKLEDFGIKCWVEVHVKCRQGREQECFEFFMQGKDSRWAIVEVEDSLGGGLKLVNLDSNGAYWLVRPSLADLLPEGM